MSPTANTTAQATRDIGTVYADQSAIHLELDNFRTNTARQLTQIANNGVSTTGMIAADAIAAILVVLLVWRLTTRQTRELLNGSTIKQRLEPDRRIHVTSQWHTTDHPPTTPPPHQVSTPHS